VAKLRFTERNGEAYIRCRFTGNETLNEAEYRYFIDNRIKGWLVPEYEGPGKLGFSGEYGVPLIDILKQGVDRQLYFRIVKNLLDIFSVAERCSFNMPNILLDPGFIAIDPQNADLYLCYLPLWYNESCNDGIVNCLRRISTFAQYDSQEDFRHVDGFMNFICRESGFTIPEAMEYIRREAPELFPADKKAPQFSRPAAAQTRVQEQSSIPGSTHQFSRPETARPAAPQPAKPEPKVIASLDEQRRNVLPELVRTERPRPAVTWPTLTRLSTGVTRNIDKPVFKIGKERDRVDLCVTENRTVSRHHATVFTRSGSCFVTDNNSTNKTYINGTPVPPDTEIKLKNGDILRLSDEEFEFREA